MDGSQITGASSSYARKYALNGLFAIDDGKDSDPPTKATTMAKARNPNSAPAKQPPKQENAKPAPELDSKKAELKLKIKQYKATEAAKSVSIDALLFDKLKENGINDGLAG